MIPRTPGGDDEDYTSFALLGNKPRKYHVAAGDKILLRFYTINAQHLPFFSWKSYTFLIVDSVIRLCVDNWKRVFLVMAPL